MCICISMLLCHSPVRRRNIGLHSFPRAPEHGSSVCRVPVRSSTSSLDAVTPDHQLPAAGCSACPGQPVAALGLSPARQGECARRGCSVAERWSERENDTQGDCLSASPRAGHEGRFVKQRPRAHTAQ